MKTKIFKAEQPKAIEEVAAILRSGGLVAYPTDTLYGLGAKAFEEKAILRVFKAKGRAQDRALPLLLARTEDVVDVATEIPIAAWRLAHEFWPGALTLVLKKNDRVPAVVCVGSDTVAVRVPAHAVTLALIREVGMPIAGTSANLSGGPPAVTADQVLRQLDGRIEAVLDGGACPGGVESTVLDLSGSRPRLIRRGALEKERLEDVLEAKVEE